MSRSVMGRYGRGCLFGVVAASMLLSCTSDPPINSADGGTTTTAAVDATEANTTEVATPVPSAPADPTAAPADPTAAPAGPTPAPTDSTPDPTATSAPMRTDGAVELWMPREPGSFEDFRTMFPVYRELDLAADLTAEARVLAALNAWRDGPTDDEIVEGFVNAARSFSSESCFRGLTVGVVQDWVIVSLCGGFRGANPDELSIFSSSLEQTVRAVDGIRGVTVLDPDGGCYDLTGDGEVDCAPVDVTDRLDQRFPCPGGLAEEPVEVGGVEEWVRTRNDASRDALEIGKLDLGTAVSAFPETLGFGDQRWWVTVRDPEHIGCVKVAAEYLIGENGPIGDPLPGVSFDLPATGAWRGWVEPNEPRGATWLLEDAFNTSIGIRVRADSGIDDFIAAQLETFERAEYTFPEDWYDEVEIPGADRAIRPISIISESGDGGIDQMLIEVDEFLIHADAYGYIEDLDIAPTEEMAAFVASVRIDRERFLAAARSELVRR